MARLLKYCKKCHRKLPTRPRRYADVCPACYMATLRKKLHKKKRR